jgi:DNA invertase Pin-like site-specific DNA recombinase
MENYRILPRSTEEQVSQGHSLATQEAKLRAYCELFEHELIAVIVDAGQSAKTANRPGLANALGMLTAGQAEGLLVAKLDRLTRSVNLCTLPAQIRSLRPTLSTLLEASELPRECERAAAAPLNHPGHRRREREGVSHVKAH